MGKLEPLSVEDLDVATIAHQAQQLSAEENNDFIGDILAASFWLLLFLMLHLGMDLAVHRQYGLEIEPVAELWQLANFAPGFAFVAFYTTRYQRRWLTRAQLFAISAFGGSYLINMVNKASYTTIIARGPSLACLWIWSIVRMELVDAVISLVCVAGYARWHDLHLG